MITIAKTIYRHNPDGGAPRQVGGQVARELVPWGRLWVQYSYGES